MGFEKNKVYTRNMNTGELTSDDKVMMTRPDGLPANVPADLVQTYQFVKGFKLGYSEEESRETQIENRIYQEERAKVLMHQQAAAEKAMEAEARRKAKAKLQEEFGENA